MAEPEWARRVRAATAYAGIEQKAMAAHLGMSESTFRRTLSRNLDRYKRNALLAEVADITGLPLAFFTADFTVLEEGENARRALAALDQANRATDASGNVAFSSEQRPIQEVLKAMREFLDRVGEIEGLDEAIRSDQDEEPPSPDGPDPPTGE